jgi:hypothetical protein
MISPVSNRSLNLEMGSEADLLSSVFSFCLRYFLIRQSSNRSRTDYAACLSRFDATPSRSSRPGYVKCRDRAEWLYFLRARIAYEARNAQTDFRRVA